MKPKDILEKILELLETAFYAPNNKKQYLDEIASLLKRFASGGAKKSRLTDKVEDQNMVKQIVQKYIEFKSSNPSTEEVNNFFQQYQLNSDEIAYIKRRANTYLLEDGDNAKIKVLYNKVKEALGVIDTLDEKQQKKLILALNKYFNPEETDNEVSEIEQDDFYDYEEISPSDLTQGDMFQYNEEVYVITEKHRGNVIRITELYSGRKKRLNIDGLDTIQILTDDAIKEVLDSFIDEKQSDRLPQIVKKIYKDYLSKN